MKRLTGGKRARGACKACRAFQATTLVKGERLCWVCGHMAARHPGQDPASSRCACAPADIYPADVRVGLVTPPAASG